MIVTEVSGKVPRAQTILARMSERFLLAMRVVSILWTMRIEVVLR